MKLPTNRKWRTLIGASALLFSAISAFGASEIPFTIEAGQLIIRAKIKNNLSVEAVVVTGSPYSYLHPDTITRLKLQLKYTNDGPVTGRNDKTLLFTELPDVVIGDEKPVSLYIANGGGGMAGTSLVTFSEKVGREISLAVGADVFKNKIVQFDFKAKVIRFMDTPPIDYKSATGNASVHRMATTFDTFYGGHITLPVIPDAMLDGTKLKTILDTGAAFPFLLSPAATKQLSLATPERGKASTTTLKTLTVGVAEFKDVPGHALGKDIKPFDKEQDYAAVVGLGVLQNLLVTFDWKKQMIVLEKR